MESSCCINSLEKQHTDRESPRYRYDARYSRRLKLQQVFCLFVFGEIYATPPWFSFQAKTVARLQSSLWCRHYCQWVSLAYLSGKLLFFFFFFLLFFLTWRWQLSCCWVVNFIYTCDSIRLNETGTVWVKLYMYAFLYSSMYCEIMYVFIYLFIYFIVLLETIRCQLWQWWWPLVVLLETIRCHLWQWK